MYYAIQVKLVIAIFLTIIIFITIIIFLDITNMRNVPGKTKLINLSKDVSKLYWKAWFKYYKPKDSSKVVM